jgi:hypothetical protein
MAVCVHTHTIFTHSIAYYSTAVVRGVQCVYSSTLKYDTRTQTRNLVQVLQPWRSARACIRTHTMRAQQRARMRMPPCVTRACTRIRDRKFRRIRDLMIEYTNKVPISTGIYHSGRSFLESTRPDILLKLLNFPPRIRVSQPGILLYYCGLD